MQHRAPFIMPLFLSTKIFFLLCISGKKPLHLDKEQNLGSDLSSAAEKINDLMN